MIRFIRLEVYVFSVLVWSVALHIAGLIEVEHFNRIALIDIVWSILSYELTDDFFVVVHDL